MASTGKRPFWMHQLVEYVLGGSLLASGLHSANPVVSSVVGAVVMLHAAMTIGPLGAFRVLSRGAHRMVDVGVIAVEILTAVQPWIDLDSGTRVIVGCIAFVHTFVWWQTSYAERVKGPRVSTEGGRSTEVGRIAGRLVGNGVNAVRRQRGDGR